MFSIGTEESGVRFPGGVAVDEARIAEHDQVDAVDVARIVHDPFIEGDDQFPAKPDRDQFMGVHVG